MCGEIFLGECPLGAIGLSYLLPDVMGNGWPGVGGESRTSLRVEAAKGTPKANTTSLKQLRVRQRAGGLAVNDGVNQTIMTSYGWLEACREGGRVGS